MGFDRYQFRVIGFDRYQFRVMDFGLTNAPETSQTLMNSILQLYLRNGAVVFLDDILIFSKSWDESNTRSRDMTRNSNNFPTSLTSKIFRRRAGRRARNFCEHYLFFVFKPIMAELAEFL